MGNNASHSGNITPCPQLDKDQRWTHSYPRTVQRLNQNKVLPDLSVDIHPKLRATNNGEILYSGGTISGRHQNGPPLPKEAGSNGIYRSNSMSFQHTQDHMPMHNGAQPRSFVSNQHNPLHKSSPRKNLDMYHRYSQYSHRDLQMKCFGSVPDLRESKNAFVESHDHLAKGRKKYKAPPPPPAHQSNTDSDNWDVKMNGEVRKARLFKTKGETKKKPQNSPNYQNTAENYRNASKTDIKNLRQKSRQIKEEFVDDFDTKETREKPNKNDLKYRMLPEMQRSRSMPDFQAELLEATQRLRTTKIEERNNEKYNFVDQKRKYSNEEMETKDHKEQKLKTLDHNISKKEYLKYKLNQMEKERNERSAENSKKEEKQWDLVTKELESSEKLLQKNKEPPSKMFYFGMDDTIQASNYNSNIVENFASSLQMCTMLPTQTYSESDISSEIDGENGQGPNEINLHLRPILPKKQLETPRFSPAAAWRLLSALEANPASSTVSDEGPVFIEDRIEKFTRQPVPESIPVAGSRSNHDKSGDSGISGDAGLPGFEENNEPVLLNRANNIQISSTYPHNLSWTPQQDLEGEEESSSEGEENRNRNYLKSTTPVTFSPRPNVFSLSLPRDNHLAAYMEEKARLQIPVNYTNLQKLKHSVSGVIGNPTPPTNKLEDSEIPTNTPNQNSNWFFSRSAPNSLNSGFNSLEIRLPKTDEIGDINNENSMPLVSLPVKNNSNCGRLMYLPELEENNCYTNKTSTNQKESWNNNTEYCEQMDNCDMSYNQFDKPRENMSGNVNDNKPENLQDPPEVIETKWKVRKPKKFTFQSTVRQIERRWLAEKLSREAERKEQQRLSELEAMQRVEEEFQRKRAKEKANIRQQLRLFSLDENSWNNKNTSNWDNKNDIPVRSEPDGAVSSSASSPTLEDSSKPNKHMSNHYYSSHLSSETKTDNYKKSGKHRIAENRMSPVVKKTSSHHSSESLEDVRYKAPTTQVLSEYRQSRREYKDYRTSSRYLSDSNESTHQNDTKHTTIHPQITYNMPKAAHSLQGVNGENLSYSNNYRKDFAHGIVLPSKSGGSTYSEDSQSNARTNSPRTPYHIT